MPIYWAVQSHRIIRVEVPSQFNSGYRPYSHLLHRTPGRPVSEVDSIGVLHVVDSVYLSYYTLSTTPIRKPTLTLSFFTPESWIDPRIDFPPRLRI